MLRLVESNSERKTFVFLFVCFRRRIGNRGEDYEKEIYEVVKNVSSITHGHEISVMGCFIYVMYGIELLKVEIPLIA